MNHEDDNEDLDEEEKEVAVAVLQAREDCIDLILCPPPFQVKNNTRKKQGFSKQQEKNGNAMGHQKKKASNIVGHLMLLHPTKAFPDLQTINKATQ